MKTLSGVFVFIIQKERLIRPWHLTTMIIVFAVTLAMFANTAIAGTITLIAEDEADAYIMSGSGANTNWGMGFLGFSPAAVGQQNAVSDNQIGRQLYRFYVPSAYTGLGPIISASLQLTTFDNYAGIPCSTAVYGLSDVWGETTVTWNTQPVVDSSEIGSVVINNPPWPFGKTFDYDVTSYIRSQALSADSLISFQQRGEDETVVGGVRWWQREGEGVSINGIVGKQPWLSIVLDAPWTSENIIIHVPETSILLLLGSGLVGIIGLKRKWRK